MDSSKEVLKRVYKSKKKGVLWMVGITQGEAKRLLEKEFEELNAFTNRSGMKKYAYAQRKNYNQLVMDTIKVSFRESSLHRRKEHQRHLDVFYIDSYSDGLLEVLDDAVATYTFNNRDWGKKKHKYNGRWFGPESTSLEDIKIAQYWGMKRKSWRAYPIYNYYSDYFFLNTHQSLVFYDIRKKKMVRGDLTKLQHPVFASIPNNKNMLKRILEIQNVDIRKNILKQLSWDYIQYAQEIDSFRDYSLVAIDFNDKNKNSRNTESRFLRRVYLKMKNPSTGETHMEAVHPDCQTVAEAINYRRYGVINLKTIANQFLVTVPDWTLAQLS